MPPAEDGVLVLKALDADGAERRIDAGGAFTMGRGHDNDWVLADPGREISKTHCRIEAEGHGFVLTDLSINGVSIEGESGPMGPGARHRLKTGDVFAIGQYRFSAAIGGKDKPPQMPAIPIDVAPAGISEILDGKAEGVEPRASLGTGEAAQWLGGLPQGSADATLRMPMGWDAPPATNAEPTPEFEAPASDFANRSEHVPAAQNALHLPQSQQLIPNDWLDDVSAATPASPPALGTTRVASALPGSAPAARATADWRRPFAEASRLDAGALAGISDIDLLARCGEAMRAFLDALDTAEAAQAVAERDCRLPTPADAGLWADFFVNNRDPLLSLLVEPHPGPARALAQRASALADRQRALGHAVAEAATRYDSRLGPEVIEAEVKHRFRPGPIAKAMAWTRFTGLHAELAAQNQGEPIPSFLVLLRKTFARAMTKRP